MLAALTCADCAGLCGDLVDGLASEEIPLPTRVIHLLAVDIGDEALRVNRTDRFHQDVKATCAQLYITGILMRPFC